MGSCFITRRGGGISKAYAVIGVTYPAGSTCTCTDGAKTLTAKDTTGRALFVIPYAGTWIVKAVSGNKSKSETVSITAEGQVETVTLSYELVLFDGVDNNAVTGGWKKAVATSLNDNPIVGNATISKNKLIYSYSDYAYGSLLTVNSVDVSDYTALHIDCTITGSFEVVQVCGAATKAIDALIKQFSNMAAAFDAKKTFSAGTYTGANAITIDISALSGAYYIGFGFYCGNAANISVNKLWLS